MNRYVTGEPVEVPGHLVGKPVQCYDNFGRIFAGIVLSARYEEEDMFADVAVANDQSHGEIASNSAVWSIQRNLRLASSNDPKPNSFATLF